MGCYSDPTAAQALGPINREFSRMEKKAKRLCALYEEGKLTPEALQAAQAQFTGLYRHVLTHALEKAANDKATPTEDSVGVAPYSTDNAVAA